MRLSIIIPTYNEKDNLLPLVKRIEAAMAGKTEDYELLFIDDSTDETPALLAKLQGEDAHVRFIHREEKSGLASAVVLGFDNARGDAFAVMDADLQHPPELLPQMLSIIGEGVDVVLPSRYIGGGESEGLSPIRTLASKSAKYASKLFLPSMRNVSDPMSGFFMFKRQVIAGAKLNPIGWKILMEVLVMGDYQHVVEIPYGFEKRNAGESKLSLKVTVQYFMHILSLASRGKRERQRYTFMLACLAGILVDVLLFAMLKTLPAYIRASIGTAAAGLVVWAMSQKTYANAASCGIMMVILLALKNGFVFLLAMTRLAEATINFFSAVLAMLVYGLFINKRLFAKGSGKVTYEVRADSNQP